MCPSTSCSIGMPAVPEDALLAVDEGDRRLARPGVHEAVVERHEPGLVAELRDVEAELAFAALDHGELRGLVLVAQLRGLFAHSVSCGLGVARSTDPAYPSPRVGSAAVSERRGAGSRGAASGSAARRAAAGAVWTSNFLTTRLALRDGARELLDGRAAPPEVRAVVDARSRPRRCGVRRRALGRDGRAGLAGGRAPRGRRRPRARRGRGRGAARGARSPRGTGAVRPDGAGARRPRRRRRGRARRPSARGRRSACVAWSRRPGAVVATDAASANPTLTGRPDPVLYAPSASVAVVVASEGARRAASPRCSRSTSTRSGGPPASRRWT